MEVVPVKVSSKSLRLRFNGCEPEYIRNVCHGRCCDAPARPTGTLIVIHPSEQAAIESYGMTVTAGLLQPRPGERRCPFKATDHLCRLHGTADKPFGCIASPFMLNSKGTLILRNRYKLLRCYNSGRRLPAYVAFRASLDLLFGEATAQELCEHLTEGGGDVIVPMPGIQWQKLRAREAIHQREGR